MPRRTQAELDALPDMPGQIPLGGNDLCPKGNCDRERGHKGPCGEWVPPSDSPGQTPRRSESQLDAMVDATRTEFGALPGQTLEASITPEQVESFPPAVCTCGRTAGLHSKDCAVSPEYMGSRPATVVSSDFPGPDRIPEPCRLCGEPLKSNTSADHEGNAMHDSCAATPVKYMGSRPGAATVRLGEQSACGGKPARTRRTRKYRNYAEEFAALSYRAIAAREVLLEFLSGPGSADSPAAPFIRAAVRLLPQGDA